MGCGSSDMDDCDKCDYYTQRLAKEVTQDFCKYSMGIKLRKRDLVKLTRDERDEFLLKLLPELGAYFYELKKGCPEIYNIIWPKTPEEEQMLVEKAKQSGNFAVIQAAFCSKDTFTSKLDLSAKLHFIADIYKPRGGLPAWQNFRDIEGDFKRELFKGIKQEVKPECISFKRDPPIIFLVKQALDNVGGGLECLQAYLSDPNVSGNDINVRGQSLIPFWHPSMKKPMHVLNMEPAYKSSAFHYVIQSRSKFSHRHQRVERGTNKVYDSEKSDREVLTALCRRLCRCEDLDINMKDSYGYTALQYALERKDNVAVVNLLLDAGADASIKGISKAGIEITAAQNFLYYNWYHKQDDASKTNFIHERALAELTADEKFVYRQLRLNEGSA